MMFEYAGEDFLRNGGDGRTLEEFRHVANRVSFLALIRKLDPGNPERVLVPLNGGEIRVSEGIATRFERFDVRDLGSEGFRISGKVVIQQSRNPAPNATIILSFMERDTAFNRSVAFANGSFATVVRETKWTDVQAYYLPPERIADCYSKKVRKPFNRPG